MLFRSPLLNMQCDAWIIGGGCRLLRCKSIKKVIPWYALEAVSGNVVTVIKVNKMEEVLVLHFVSICFASYLIISLQTCTAYLLFWIHRQPFHIYVLYVQVMPLVGRDWSCCSILFCNTYVIKNSEFFGFNFLYLCRRLHPVLHTLITSSRLMVVVDGMLRWMRGQHLGTFM